MIKVDKVDKADGISFRSHFPKLQGVIIMIMIMTSSFEMQNSYN